MDVQKTMEFILEQQVAFTANLQELSGEIKELRVATSDLKAATSDLKAVALGHESDIQAHTEWLSGLSGAMQRLTDQMQDGFVKMAAADAANAAANQETRGSLNILIRTVQDMIPHLPKQ